ncbi:MAG TPA: hypothetical protein VKB79_21565 [Bryobacteraceae bacterium]|nr:hypothetical protein [Bryobacteraceae bacterium]
MKNTGISEVPPGFPTEREREAIRSQLERMLASPLFRNSKRCASLLRYVVDQTLDGRTVILKERTLGVEVFSRDADYDTAADPIVRATAAEVRKRIAQYYHDHTHQAEIRIDLSPRSYIPEFSPAETQPAPEAATPAIQAPPVTHGRTKMLAIAAGVVAVAVSLWWFGPWAPKNALDRFWAPVVASPSKVVLCIGQRQFVAPNKELPAESNEALARVGDAPRPHWAVSLAQLYYLGSQNVALSDATTLARLAGLLDLRKRPFRVLGERSTSYSDLQDGPVILIGGLNNDWTIRLMGPLRFSFERNNQMFWIKDRENPAKAEYALDYDTPYMSLTQDYALISRAFEPSTQRMVVVAAGLTGYGTLAAGEFLTNESYMEEAVKGAPAGWQRKNLQFVIATEVIKGNSGPPHVVNRYFW